MNSLYAQLELEEAPPLPTANCGTPEMHERLLAEDFSYQNAHDAAEMLCYENIMTVLQQQQMAKLASGRENVYTIPVVVHVMHLPGTPVGIGENISRKQIEQGLSFLNDAFRGKGAYASGFDNTDAGVNKADVKVAFKLATTDPNGRPTDGIVRVPTSYSNLFRLESIPNRPEFKNQGRYIKSLSRWDTESYLNIWVVNEICDCQTCPKPQCNIGGYAYYSSAHGKPYDGVVIEGDLFGSDSDYTSVIHEVGHYLNLYHTFEGGCENGDCLQDGDKVCDTPPCLPSPPLSCQSGERHNSCDTDMTPSFGELTFMTDVEDMYENFMSSGVNSGCRTSFTPGQKDRMRIALKNIRGSLLESEGLKKSEAVLVHFTNAATSVPEQDGESIAGCRAYIDYPVGVHLYNPSDEPVYVDLAAYSETATKDLDYSLLSKRLMFGPGKQYQEAKLRIYNDGSMEPIETLEIEIADISGGNAERAEFKHTYLITILDDDEIPDTEPTIVLMEDFENGLSAGWRSSAFGSHTNNRWTVSEISGRKCAYVASGDDVTYEPVKSHPILVSPVIDGRDYSNMTLSFDFMAAGIPGKDFGRIYYRLPNSQSKFRLLDGSFNAPFVNVKDFITYTLDLAPDIFDNQQFELAFAWKTEADTCNPPGFVIDNVNIVTDPLSVETRATNTPLNQALSAYLGPQETVYFYSNSGNLVAKVRNLSDHDYGCTEVDLTQVGTGNHTINLPDGKTVQMALKTVSFQPSQGVDQGKLEVSVYYTEQELESWLTATELTPDDIQMIGRIKAEPDSAMTEVISIAGTDPFTVYLPSPLSNELTDFGTAYELTAIYEGETEKVDFSIGHLK